MKQKFTKFRSSCIPLPYEDGYGKEIRQRKRIIPDISKTSVKTGVLFFIKKL